MSESRCDEVTFEVFRSEDGRVFANVNRGGVQLAHLKAGQSYKLDLASSETAKQISEPEPAAGSLYDLALDQAAKAVGCNIQRSKSDYHRGRDDAVLIILGLKNAAPQDTARDATSREEADAGRNRQYGAPAGAAPHERGALIERVAKALCRFSHPTRSLEEALSPNRALWQRYVPDAEVVIQEIYGVPTAGERPEGTR